MDIVQLLGFVAGGFVVIASAPQVVKIIKSKQTRDISLPMYIFLNIGTFLWIVYGLITHQPAVYVINILFLMFNLTILILKIKHG